MESMNEKTRSIEKLNYECELRFRENGLNSILIERFTNPETGKLERDYLPAYVVTDFITLEVIEARYFYDGREIENPRADMPEAKKIQDFTPK